MIRWREAFILFMLPALAGISPARAARPAAEEGLAPSRLFPGARFDARIPTQKEVIGFDPGARPLRHNELLHYLRALADASPRARLEPYARSYEGRELVTLAVADPETMNRLDAFRAEHAARVDPRGRLASQDALALDGARAVAWMAYAIHGDELSSSDAAAAVAYWLVAGEDRKTRALRHDLVILIDPCENPDGRERFLAQTTSFAHRTPNPDTEDLSHTTVWPWGRGNHYLFDLNRDWFSLVMPESERSAVIASWNPQLMVDSHEMGPHSTYLFSPPRHPFNPLLPVSHQEWAERFAADQARALDARGYPYYTREWNEEFFPGYGSSWASYLGAIGILYEMSSTEGTLVRQRGAGVRTYAQAVEHQVASSVANLSTLHEHRRSILRDFVAHRRAMIDTAGGPGPAAWLLPRGRHPERTDHLAALLRRQSIEVLLDDGPFSIAGLRDARTGEKIAPGQLPASAWLVPLDQPAAALARQILDPHIPMESPFLREEREHLERGKGTRLYETTAWSLPLAYDIEAAWTPETVSREGWSAAPIPPVRSGLETAPDPFGYLMDGASDRTLPALADLLARQIRVRVAEKPFRIEGHDYPQGTLLVEKEGNPAALQAALAEVAGRDGVLITAVSTALAQAGPDLGGSFFHPLIPPRIGIWTGSPVSPSSYGALWRLLDEDLHLRFNGLELIRAARIDLARYNVLVFPPLFGEAGTYAEIFGEKGLTRLKKWIESGGTAIGIGSGAEFLADAKLDLTRTRLRRQALEKFPPVVLGPTARQAAEAGLFRAVGLRAPEEKDDKGSPEGGRRGRGAAAASLYDVAPLVGPGARPFAAGHPLGTPVTAKPVNLPRWVAPLLPPGQEKPKGDDLERADERLRRFAPRGCFLRLEVDPDLWLAWGLPDELPALIGAGDTLVAGPPVQVAARFAGLDRLHLGGLLWPEAAGRLARTAYATREAVGGGQVILFLSEPEFRGWTLGTRRLLTNALLYGPGLGTRWPNPW
ncbi:MAG: M14 family zinc carboxypeptidase [Acidobacteriota bacterium]